MKKLWWLLLASGTIFTTNEAIAKPKPPSDINHIPHPERSVVNDPKTLIENLSSDPAPNQDDLTRRFIEADTLYRNGDTQEAIAIYRELKPPFASEAQALPTIAPPIYEVAELSPAGSVYWRIAQEGMAQQLTSKTLVSLGMLVEKEPQFIPGHIAYGQQLQGDNQPEAALAHLSRIVGLYDQEPELLKYAIAVHGEQKQWLEGSLLARQFTVISPDHPQVEEFQALADDYLNRYQSHLRSQIQGNAFANILTGVVGYALGGGALGPLSAIDSLRLLIQGEESVGANIAGQVARAAPLVDDPEVLAYVNRIADRLVPLAGRDLNYDFQVILDDDLNAFALPGGKIFINAGAILDSHSEAELAGLLAHEISHAVLSHGFQLVTQGNLTANLLQYVPFGGTAGGLIVMDYSRDMERQADIVGTRILAASGYAADGLRNLTVTIEGIQGGDRPPEWLSTHPHPGNRVAYLEQLILQNNYNRYGYEGLEEHQRIQNRLREIIDAHQEE